MNYYQLLEPGEAAFNIIEAAVVTFINPRYANYARVNGRSYEEQLAQDRIDWPGGPMIGFVAWNKSRLVEASREIPDAFFQGRLIDHDDYDTWLTAWVNNELENKKTE